MDKRFIFRYRTIGVMRGRRRNGRAHLLDMVRDLVKPGPGGKSPGLKVRPEPRSAQADWSRRRHTA